MAKRLLLLTLILLPSILLLCGCGEDGEPTGPTAAELTRQGWAKFEAGNDPGASADFQAAIGLDPEYAEAYFGLGWADLRQSNAGLAEDAFKTYLLLEAAGSNDAEAGLALAYHAQDRFQEAIDKVEGILSSDASWSFSHDISIDYLDLALILAHSYYEIAEYQQSLDVVKQYFEASFNPNVETDEGRNQLAAKLESLYTG